MRVVIVDDEKRCVEVVISLLTKYCSGIDVVGISHSIAEGRRLIKQYSPDIVFVDIEMPDGTGVELVGQMQHEIGNVVFITGHDKYAINAFRLSAVDFLLKPLDGRDLAVAVEKCKERRRNDALKDQLKVLQQRLGNDRGEKSQIVLSDKDSLYFVKMKEIILCEATGSYSKFKLIDGKEILVSKNLKNYEDLLPNEVFVRPHHSFLINITHVKRFDRNEGGFLVMVDGSRIPVASRRKDELLDMLTQGQREV